MKLHSTFFNNLQNEVAKKMTNVGPYLEGLANNSPKLIVDKAIQQANLSAKQLAKGLKPAPPQLAQASSQGKPVDVSLSTSGSNLPESMMSQYKMPLMIIGGIALAYYVWKK